MEYKNPGSFDVKLVARNSKYSATSEKLNYIKADSTPIAHFSFQTNGTIVQFTDKSKYSKTLFWEFGDGKTSTEQNPSHEYLPGLYKSKQIVENLCGRDTFVHDIVIGSGLIAGFNAMIEKGCIPFEVQFQNTSIGASSYEWTMPGATPSFSTEKEPKVIYNSIGKYDVSLKIKNTSDSLVLTKQQYITVGDLPKAEFQKAVTGFSVFFNNQSVNGSNYNWNFGDSKSSVETSPTHTYSAEGEYQVQLITNNDCGNDTITQIVAVYLVPKIDFIADTTIVCGIGEVQFTSKTSSDVNSWNWIFDGGSPDNSTEKNPLVYYDKKGLYSVKLTVRNSNGENSLIRQTYIHVISPVLCPENIFHKNSLLNGDNISPIKAPWSEQIKVYPNPFSEELFISGLELNKEHTIRLVNYLGIEVMNNKFMSNNQVLHLNLNELNAGPYIISIENNKNTFTKALFLSK